jgi:hypothetical protein
MAWVIEAELAAGEVGWALKGLSWRRFTVLVSG